MVLLEFKSLVPGGASQANNGCWEFVKVPSVQIPVPAGHLAANTHNTPVTVIYFLFLKQGIFSFQGICTGCVHYLEHPPPALPSHPSGLELNVILSSGSPVPQFPLVKSQIPWEEFRFC